MRIVFCGTPESAVPSLDAVVGRGGTWEVPAVLTQPDRPAGRGRKPVPSPVKERALRHGLEVITPERLKDVRELLQSLRPDVVAVVAYGHIFRKWLLELPPLGCVNVHFSLLPRHRGVAPVAWAILAGDGETGVTTMRMDRGVDTGAVYARAVVPIASDDTRATLTRRLADEGGRLLVETLGGLESGTAHAIPQDEEGATYARRLEKEDGRIDWTRPAAEIARLVRGLNPWPGAFTTYHRRNLKIHEAAPRSGRLAPGTLGNDGGRAVVGTGEGLLELKEIQMEGKPRMQGEAWLRGARPRDDEVLGAG